MGGQKSTIQKELSLFINHPIFKTAKLLIQNNDQRKIQISVGCTQKQYKKWVQLQSQNIYPQHLMLPLQWTYEASGMCGDSGIAKINFNDYPYLLSEQIYNRRGAKTQFDQCDLWYILYGLASAKRDVALFNKKLGDIQPVNIFINDMGQFKVASTSSWPGSSKNFIKTIEGQTTYLAPQQIKVIDSLKNEQVDQQTAEVFSIGFTLLSAATISDLSYIYGTKGKNFDYNAAQNKMSQLIRNNKYSQILKATILNMCEFDPISRMTSKQLFEWIQNYKGKIKARSNFIIDQAPTKLHNQVKILRSALTLVGLSIKQSRRSQFERNTNNTNALNSLAKIQNRFEIQSLKKKDNNNIQQKYRNNNIKN